MQQHASSARLTLKDTVYAVCEQTTGHYIAGLTVGQPRAAESLADADLSFNRGALEVLASRALPNTPHEIIRLDQAPNAPQLTRCPHCTSLYCGPIRCRFSMQPITAQHGGAQSQFLAVLLIFIGLAGTAVVIDRNRAQAITKLELPAEACRRPAAGEVLHITVIRKPDGRIVASDCITATSQSTRKETS